jgi:hypothetical protein
MEGDAHSMTISAYKTRNAWTPFPVSPRESRGGRVPSTAQRQRLPPQGKCPRGAGPYARRTWFTGWGRGRLKGAQVAEVGRSPSGAVKAKHKRGLKFRAPYSGYGLRQHPRLIPIRRVLHLRDLAPTCAERINRHVQANAAFQKARREEDRGGPRQTEPKEERDVPGRFSTSIRP